MTLWCIAAWSTPDVAKHVRSLWQINMVAHPARTHCGAWGLDCAGGRALLSVSCPVNLWLHSINLQVATVRSGERSAGWLSTNIATALHLYVSLAFNVHCSFCVGSPRGHESILDANVCFVHAGSGPVQQWLPRSDVRILLLPNASVL